MLQKPHGDVIGALGNFYALKTNFKFNEPSEISFEYPKRVNGKKCEFYDKIVGDKLIQIDPYGIFVITGCKESAKDGVKIKKVECKSREQTLASKRAFFAEGTYNLWNPADVQNTLLGMLFEGLDWSIGFVSSSLIGRYRTFPETSGNVLDLLSGKIQEKFNCVFDFDSYNRTVDVLDASEPVAVMPVFLSYQNLLKSEELQEKPDSIRTVLTVRGADGVDIHNVNPTGDNKIYNLNYYISNGDIPANIASKWRTWENAVFAQQAYYTSVVALRNTANTRLVSAKTELVELKNSLKTLDNTRATFLQMLETPNSAATQKYLKDNGITTSNVESYFNGRLDATAKEYSDIEADVAALETKIKSVESEKAGHDATLAGINSSLSVSNYFTASELAVLKNYFKEDEFSDNTFAVYDVDMSDGGTYNKISSSTLSFKNVTWTDVQCGGGHAMAAITGGSVTMSGGGIAIKGDIIRGTFDHVNGEVICSLYLSSCMENGVIVSGGNLTYTASASYNDATLLSGMTKHSDTIYSEDKTVSHTINYYTGSPKITGSKANVYFTRNATEYQQYSVEQDLYDHASKVLSELAWPEYEFDIESGNFVFAQKFEPFKNAIQLGCGLHLELDEDMYLTPMLIELHLNFDKPDDFSLVFSNRFQRPDQVNTLKSLLDKASSTGATVDMSRFDTYENRNTVTWVKNLLAAGLDAAMNQIMAGENQLVTIDKAGIKIDSENGNSIIYLNNGMIALYDKRTNTMKMAMGHFYNEATGMDYVGVLADVIGGTLLAGQNLIIECPDINGGVTQFKVDSSGVIINNGRMYMNTSVGAMGWDAKYGFFAGKPGLFQSVENGHVRPVCVDSSGKLILDNEGFPKDVNVWIGIDGKAYFRGDVHADNGYFKGEVYATKGTFKGTVQASDFLDANGNSMLTGGKWKSEWLELKGLTIKNAKGETTFQVDSNGNVSIATGSITISGGSISIGGTASNPNFKVDNNGNVSMKGSIDLLGNINLSGASSITWGSSNIPVKYQFSVDGVSGWHNFMTASDKYRRDSLDGGATWGAAYQFRGTDGQNGQNGEKGEKGDKGDKGDPGDNANVDFESILSALQDAHLAEDISETFITADSVGTPHIYGGKIHGGEIYGSEFYGNIFSVFPEPDAEDTTGGLNIYGYSGNKLYHMFKLAYNFRDGAFVDFSSPASAIASWNFNNSYFYGNIDFSSADVTGITAKFK